MIIIRASLFELWYYLCIDVHHDPFMYPSLEVAYVIEPAGDKTALQIAKELINRLQPLPEFKQYQLQIDELKLQPAINES